MVDEFSFSGAWMAPDDETTVCLSAACAASAIARRIWLKWNADEQRLSHTPGSSLLSGFCLLMVVLPHVPQGKIGSTGADPPSLLAGAIIR
jgi:hypothetical protein